MRFRQLLMAILAYSALASGVTTAAEQTLTTAWPVNAGPLNPHLYTPNQMYAQSMVYEPLVKYQQDGSVKPWLAESWSSAPDGKTWLFNLRQDVTFSNGEAFDAAAVVANFNAVLNNRERHAWLELTNQIEEVKALGRYQLQIKLKSAYYPFLQELALPRPFRFIAPSQFKEGQTKNGILKPIGTGPWVLEASHLNQDDIFVRNEHYWGNKPAVSKLTVKVISDPASRAVAMETGDVDLLYGNEGLLPLDTFERFSHMPTLKTRLSQSVETVMLALNSAQGPTSEQLVREALNYGVDKPTMVKSVLYGTQQVADTLFAPSVPYADIGLKARHYDPALAAKLLDQAGWLLPAGKSLREKGGKPLDIELAYTGTDALSKSMAEIIQANLRQIGVAVHLVGEEESSIFARMRDGRFGMIFNRTWGAPYDPHAFMSSMRVPSHADFQAQRGLPDKAVIDKEIGQVLTSRDEQTRQQLYRDVLTRLHNDAVYLPLTYVSQMSVARAELGNVPFAPIVSEIPFDQITPVAP